VVVDEVDVIAKGTTYWKGRKIYSRSARLPWWTDSECCMCTMTVHAASKEVVT
jgi:hypothetical protein